MVFAPRKLTPTCSDDDDEPRGNVMSEVADFFAVGLGKQSTQMLVPCPQPVLFFSFESL